MTTLIGSSNKLWLLFPTWHGNRVREVYDEMYLKTQPRTRRHTCHTYHTFSVNSLEFIGTRVGILNGRRERDIIIFLI